MKNKAIANYKHWHKKEPSALIETEYDFPKTVYKLGNAVQIFYYSDKWHPDGEGYTYYHDFESRPSVYVAETSKVLKFIKEERALHPHATKTLTGITNLSGNVSLPALAVMEELTVDFGGYKQRIKFKSEQPFVCCSGDRKALLFLCNSGLIVVKGGKMRVTERGIVN